MKILCISDQIDPLVYSASLKERFGDVDLVLAAGDLPMEYLDFIVSTLNRPLYFIFGNHNLSDYAYYHKSISNQPIPDTYTMEHYHGAIYAGFKVLKDKNILIAGTSGSIRYNQGLNQFTDFEMLIKLLKLVPKLLLNKIKYGRYLDIFLTHSPPLDIHDKKDPCHRGFKYYRWFLQKFKPKYMIHGHIHLYDLQAPRISVFESTTVINAYSHYLLEFQEY